MLYAQRYEKLRRTLREARLKAHLTQIELAQNLGQTQSYISKIERGEQYLDALGFVLWCEACGASPGELIEKI